MDTWPLTISSRRQLRIWNPGGAFRTNFPHEVIMPTFPWFTIPKQHAILQGGGFSSWGRRVSAVTVFVNVVYAAVHDGVATS